MATSKYPELEAMRDQLEGEKKVLLKKSEPLHRERDALLSKIQPLEVQLRGVDEKIRAAERPRLGEINRQLAGIARALGGKAMSEGKTQEAVA